MEDNGGRVNGIWDWLEEGWKFVVFDVMGSVFLIDELLDDLFVIENFGGDVFILLKLDMKFEIWVLFVLNLIDLFCGRW